MGEKTFREKAEDCRRLAENTFDERAVRILLEMASEYEERHLMELLQRSDPRPINPIGEVG